MGACRRSHEMMRPSAFAARPASIMPTTSAGCDVDDARLADEFEPEIHWNGRHRADRRFNLRLHEGERNGFFPCLPEHVLIETGVTGRPFNDLRLVQAKTLRNAFDQRRDFEPEACRPPREAIGHGLRPVAASLQALIVLADQRREAGREEVEGNRTPEAPAFVGKLADETGDAGGPKGEKAREQRVCGCDRVRASGRGCFRRNDKAFASRSPSPKILTTASRSRPSALAARRQWSQKHDSISSAPFAGEGKRILSRKTPLKS